MLSNIKTTAAASLIVGFTGVNISLMQLYPHLIHLIITVSPLIFALVVFALNDVVFKDEVIKDDDDDDEGDEGESEEDVKSNECVPFEGIMYEMNIDDLFDIIFERLRDKMYGKNTTVNADEIREVFMAAYSVTKGESISMDAIECIIDMIVYCIEIMEEAGSSAAAESPEEREPEVPESEAVPEPEVPESEAVPEAVPEESTA
jgi:hypothetical protein